MSNAVARRYAKGLLQAVLQLEQPGQGPETVARELEALADTVSEFSELERLLVNPAVDATGKVAVLDEIAEKIGAGAVTRRLLGVLAANDRLEQVRGIAGAYRGAVDAHLGVLDAEVTTPAPLSEEDVSALRDRLAGATGRTMRLTTKTDPELLGGMVTRIGDVIYDGSLRHHLATLRRRMANS